MIKFIFIVLFIGGGLYYGFNYLNNNGFLSRFNNPASAFIAGSYKITCIEDGDCHLTQADCNPCSCGFVANKAWQPYCPFKKDKNVFCSACEKFPSSENIKCVNTECKIVY